MDENRFETDYEKLSDEELNAYYNAATEDIPDLWDRISAGFDEEINNVANNVTNNVANNIVNINEYQTKDRDLKLKRQRRKKMLPILAAAILVFAIGIPVYLHNANNTKKSDYSASTDLFSGNASKDEEAFCDAEDTTAASMAEDSEGAVNTFVPQNTTGASVMPESNAAAEEIYEADKEAVLCEAYCKVNKGSDGYELTIDEIIEVDDSISSEELCKKKIIVVNSDTGALNLDNASLNTDRIRVKFMIEEIGSDSVNVSGISIE